MDEFSPDGDLVLSLHCKWEKTTRKVKWSSHAELFSHTCWIERFQFEDDEWDVAFSPPQRFPTRGSDLRSEDRVTLVDATAGTHTFTDTFIWFKGFLLDALGLDSQLNFLVNCSSAWALWPFFPFTDNSGKHTQVKYRQKSRLHSKKSAAIVLFHQWKNNETFFSLTSTVVL